MKKPPAAVLEVRGEDPSSVDRLVEPARARRWPRTGRAGRRSGRRSRRGRRRGAPRRPSKLRGRRPSGAHAVEHERRGARRGARVASARRGRARRARGRRSSGRSRRRGPCRRAAAAGAARAPRRGVARVASELRSASGATPSSSRDRVERRRRVEDVPPLEVAGGGHAVVAHDERAPRPAPRTASISSGVQVKNHPSSRRPSGPGCRRRSPSRSRRRAPSCRAST